MSASASPRHDIRTLLARDEAYDEDPRGEPPVSVARYRRALRAVLDAEPAMPSDVASGWSAGERTAYQVGGQATLRAVLSAVHEGLVVPAPRQPDGVQRP
jgi:hypothetical protein